MMNSSEFADSYDDINLTGDKDLDVSVLETPVSQVMVRNPFMVSPDDSVVAAVDSMNAHRIGCVLVQKDGKLVGILTERDLLRKVIFRDGNRAWKVEAVMTRHPATLPESASVAYALNKMSVDGYRHIPIVDDAGQAVGLVSVKDIIHFFVEYFPDSVINLPSSPDKAITHTEDGA
jgi:CBS domain-containing protein